MLYFLLKSSFFDLFVFHCACTCMYFRNLAVDIHIPFPSWLLVSNLSSFRTSPISYKLFVSVIRMPSNLIKLIQRCRSIACCLVSATLAGFMPFFPKRIWTRCLVARASYPRRENVKCSCIHWARALLVKFPIQWFSILCWWFLKRPAFECMVSATLNSSRVSYSLSKNRNRAGPDISCSSSGFVISMGHETFDGTRHRNRLANLWATWQYTFKYTWK